MAECLDARRFLPAGLRAPANLCQAGAPSMNLRAWMPLYIADFQIDTRELKEDELGVYVTLLCLAWRREGPLPGDLKELKSMVQRSLSEFHGLTFNRIVPKLLKRYFYQDSVGDWRQKRIEKELRIAREWSERSSRNSRERWSNNSKKKDQTEIFQGDRNALGLDQNKDETNYVHSVFSTEKSERTQLEFRKNEDQNEQFQGDRNALGMLRARVLQSPSKKESLNGELGQGKEGGWVLRGGKVFKVGEFAPAYPGQSPNRWKKLTPEDCE
jgi:uncharacterized protein YdaU (DUF1376 family)